jgi:acylpyruvate hydrolase
MRFVNFDSGDGPQAGRLTDDGVVALSDPGEGGLGALVRGGLALVGDGGPAFPLGEVRLLPPITDPGKIICIGLNYKAHAAEAGIEPPDTPTFFAKFANALAAPGATVPLPPYSSKVDYEAEVAFVIGDRAKDVSEDDALDFVAGYTLLNDLSARDFQFKTPGCSTALRLAALPW